MIVVDTNVIAYLLLEGSHTGEAELLMQGKEFQVGSAQVLGLASASGCSSYDCEFVALAQDLGVPLVTSDSMVLSKFGSTAVSMQAFCS